MPSFPRLAIDRVDLSRTADKLRALRWAGVPYSARDIETAGPDADAESAAIASNLRDEGIAAIDARSEVVALIAYLQRLGTKPSPIQTRSSNP
jgi:cytochrome c oxidase cbb3-type subunit I/II